MTEIAELADLANESVQVLHDADCLYSLAEIDQALDEMASSITSKLKGSNPLVLCVMNGGLIPTGTLLPKLNFPLQIDYIHASRYGKEIRGSNLNWLVSPKFDLKDRTVLIIDDIHDEGITLANIIDYCQTQGAVQTLSAVLINKRHDRKQGTAADFVGLDVPDRFVFGYGMDYKGYLRNAPGIYAVKGL